MSDRIDRDVINALIAGHFADPFSVLGMHKTTAGLEVRALLPDATDVWVIEPKTGRKLAKLECLDSRGFFSGVIPRRKNFFRYQSLRIRILIDTIPTFYIFKIRIFQAYQMICSI